MGVFYPLEVKAKRLWRDANWFASSIAASLGNAEANAFYRKIKAEAYLPDELIRVLPNRNVIYVVVPKAASTRIRTLLAKVGGQYSRRLKARGPRKFREPQGLRSMTVSSFYELATSPKTFRFSFVRNPYDRLLSGWANKFQGKPLIMGAPGAPEVDDYLRRRAQIDSALPAGADKTLSFPDFVIFATSSATTRSDPHLQLQDDILSVPGIELEFVGRMERFNEDCAYVLDRIGATDDIKHEATNRVNPSRHGTLLDYYTSEMAERVYRAYERDFDRFGYSRHSLGV
ncbi:MAG TPA: sulfotransferase family protein [Pseudorhodoplanes sp.]|jgi:hypothetical protein|nr:sulfotransferase family protein [Pseudorhodoplanes sp.]